MVHYLSSPGGKYKCYGVAAREHDVLQVMDALKIITEDYHKLKTAQKMAALIGFD